MGRILLYADELIGRWVEAQTGVAINPPYTSFGIVGPRGQIEGAVIFNSAHESDIELSIVAPRRLSRGVLRAIASYVFETAGCQRVTARTRASSSAVRRVIEKAGFRQEGVLRSYYQDGEDAILYGMLKGECRWLT